MDIKLADLIEPFEDDITSEDVWLLSEPWEPDTLTDIDLEHEIIESFNLHCEME